MRWFGVRRVRSTEQQRTAPYQPPSIAILFPRVFLDSGNVLSCGRCLRHFRFHAMGTVSLFIAVIACPRRAGTTTGRGRPKPHIRPTPPPLTDHEGAHYRANILFTYQSGSGTPTRPLSILFRSQNPKQTQSEQLCTVDPENFGCPVLQIPVGLPVFGHQSKRPSGQIAGPPVAEENLGRLRIEMDGIEN